MTSDSAQEFVQAADAFMRQLLTQLDGFDPDELEADATEGVIKVAFADGRICVMNRQSAAQQIWLAEGASAWHFARDANGEWMCTKGRGSLRTVLATIISERLGRPISLAAS